MKENTNIFSSQSLKEQEQQGQRVGGEQRDPDQDQQHQDQDPVQPEASDCPHGVGDSFIFYHYCCQAQVQSPKVQKPKVKTKGTLG